MKLHHTYHFSRVRRGFTLIELLVTLSILLVMLGLINFIFRDTQRAVSLGIETGEAIAAQRGIASQIRRDFTAMVGPHQGGLPNDDAGGGFLVLTQDLAGDNGAGILGNNGSFDIAAGEGIDIALPTNNSAANAGRTSERRLIRSDQIGFIRNRGTDQPVAPRTENEFTSRRVPDNFRTVQYSRVWYGHLLRTLDSGIPATTVPSPERLGTVGAPNENPLDWLLGRQAVFLDGTRRNPGDTADAAPPGGIYSEGLFANSVVNGYGSGSVPGAVGEQLASGLTDFAFVALEYNPDNPHPNQSLVGDSGLTVSATTPAPLPILPALPDSPTALDESAYENVALAISTYVRGRLLANPTPPSAYETWQIAQAHAILNEGVSDFAIEFAADMYGGGNTPNVAARSDPGVGFSETPNVFRPDGQIDTDRQGNIAWYGWAGTRGGNFVGIDDSGTRPRLGVRIFAPAAGYHPLVALNDPGLPNAQASAAFVWRHDRFDPGEYDPVADEWFRTTSNTNSPLDPTAVGSAFCDWPYLLRIRYRVHDPKGQIASGQPLFRDSNNNNIQDGAEPFVDSRNGIWFEQIIPVNRPIPRRVVR